MCSIPLENIQSAGAMIPERINRARAWLAVHVSTRLCVDIVQRLIGMVDEQSAEIFNLKSQILSMQSSQVHWTSFGLDQQLAFEDVRPFPFD